MVLCMKRGRLARKSGAMRKTRNKPYYVTKYYDITPKDMPVTWRVIARTKTHAIQKFMKMLHDKYQWRPQVWDEFKDHNIRLASIKRWKSPIELVKERATGDVIAKAKITG